MPSRSRHHRNNHSNKSSNKNRNRRDHNNNTKNSDPKSNLNNNKKQNSPSQHNQINHNNNNDNDNQYHVHISSNTNLNSNNITSSNNNNNNNNNSNIHQIQDEIMSEFRSSRSTINDLSILLVNYVRRKAANALFIFELINEWISIDYNTNHLLHVHQYDTDDDVYDDDSSSLDDSIAIDNNIMNNNLLNAAESSHKIRMNLFRVIFSLTDKVSFSNIINQNAWCLSIIKILSCGLPALSSHLIHCIAKHIQQTVTASGNPDQLRFIIMFSRPEIIEQCAELVEFNPSIFEECFCELIESLCDNYQPFRNWLFARLCSKNRKLIKTYLVDFILGIKSVSNDNNPTPSPNPKSKPISNSKPKYKRAKELIINAPSDDDDDGDNGNDNDDGVNLNRLMNAFKFCMRASNQLVINNQSRNYYELGHLLLTEVISIAQTIQYEMRLRDNTHDDVFDSMLAIMYCNLGSIYLYQHKYNEALYCSNEALELDLNCIQAHRIRSEYYIKYKNDYNTSINDLYQILEKDIHHPYATNTKKQILNNKSKVYKCKQINSNNLHSMNKMNNIKDDNDNKDDINHKIPCPREKHSAVSYRNDKLIIYGGSPYDIDDNDDDNKTALNDLWILDINNNRWMQLDTIGSSPSPRHSHSADIIEHKLFIIGGAHTNQLYKPFINKSINNNNYIYNRLKLVKEERNKITKKHNKFKQKQKQKNKQLIIQKEHSNSKKKNIARKYYSLRNKDNYLATNGINSDYYHYNRNRTRRLRNNSLKIRNNSIKSIRLNDNNNYRQRLLNSSRNSNTRIIIDNNQSDADADANVDPDQGSTSVSPASSTPIIITKKTKINNNNVYKSIKKGDQRVFSLNTNDKTISFETTVTFEPNKNNKIRIKSKPITVNNNHGSKSKQITKSKSNSNSNDKNKSKNKQGYKLGWLTNFFNTSTPQDTNTNTNAQDNDDDDIDDDIVNNDANDDGNDDLSSATMDDIIMLPFNKMTKTQLKRIQELATKGIIDSREFYGAPHKHVDGDDDDSNSDDIKDTGDRDRFHLNDDVEQFFYENRLYDNNSNSVATRITQEIRNDNDDLYDINDDNDYDDDESSYDDEDDGTQTEEEYTDDDNSNDSDVININHLNRCGVDQKSSVDVDTDDIDVNDSDDDKSDIYSCKSKCESLIFPQYNQSSFPSIEILDLKNNKWIRPSTTGTPPKSIMINHRSIVIDRKIYIFPTNESFPYEFQSSYTLNHQIDQINQINNCLCTCSLCNSNNKKDDDIFNKIGNNIIYKNMVNRLNRLKNPKINDKNNVNDDEKDNINELEKYIRMKKRQRRIYRNKLLSLHNNNNHDNDICKCHHSSAILRTVCNGYVFETDTFSWSSFKIPIKHRKIICNKNVIPVKYSSDKIAFVSPFNNNNFHQYCLLFPHNMEWSPIIKIPYGKLSGYNRLMKYAYTTTSSNNNNYIIIHGGILQRDLYTNANNFNCNSPVTSLLGCIPVDNATNIIDGTQQDKQINNVNDANDDNDKLTPLWNIDNVYNNNHSISNNNIPINISSHVSQIESLLLNRIPSIKHRIGPLHNYNNKQLVPNKRVASASASASRVITTTTTTETTTTFQKQCTTTRTRTITTKTVYNNNNNNDDKLLNGSPSPLKRCINYYEEEEEEEEEEELHVNAPPSLTVTDDDKRTDISDTESHLFNMKSSDIFNSAYRDYSTLFLSCLEIFDYSAMKWLPRISLQLNNSSSSSSSSSSSHNNHIISSSINVFDKNLLNIPRINHTITIIGNKLVIFGGISTTDVLIIDNFIKNTKLCENGNYYNKINQKKNQNINDKTYKSNALTLAKFIFGSNSSNNDNNKLYLRGMVQCANCLILECNRFHFRTCSGCAKVQYCSKKCQRQHWKHGHRRSCEKNHIKS